MTSSTDQGPAGFNIGWVLAIGVLVSLVPLAAALYPWAPPPWTAPAVASVGSLLAVYVGRRAHHPTGAIWHRSVTWLAFGLWPFFALKFGPSMQMFIMLGIIVLAAGMTYTLSLPVDENPAAAPFVGGIEPGWKTIIDRVCSVQAPGVTITRKLWWATGAGFTLTVEGPPGSSFSSQDLRNNLNRLGAAAKLKAGCIPSAEEGENQGQAVLHVPTVYALAVVQNYPADYEPLSVNGLIPIGVFADGSVVDLTVREDRSLMVSRTGGGKTNAMDVLTAGLVRCPDVVVWHLDMNSGGMATNWVLPWMQNKIDGPAIDWVAFNEEEAVLMSRAALRITLARKAQYAAAAANDDRLVPLTPELPAIIIMIDEAAEVLGFDSPYPEIQQNLMAVARMGRAVGVTMECSVLRCTGETMPVALRKLFANRIGLKVGESTEFDYLFEQSRGLNPNMIKNRGEGFICRSGAIEDDGPVKFRTYKLNPSQIVEVSRAVAHRRPDLDGISVAAADAASPTGDAYTDRWERAAGWLWSLVGQGPEQVPAPAADRPVVPGLLGGVVEKVLEQQDEAAFSDVLKSWDMPAVEPDRPGTTQMVGAGAQLVIEIVTEPMRTGEIVRAVLKRRDVTRQTVDSWVKEAIAAGRLERAAKHGVYQPAGWEG